jgi:predicted dehydrogenase
LAGIWEEDSKVVAEYAAIGVKPLKLDEAPERQLHSRNAVESAVKDHAKHALLALEAGKHVHVEKPPADTMAAFHKLASLAEKKKLLLQSGYMWRYNPAVNKALEAARSGWLGEVYMVRGEMNTLIAPERRPEWGMFKADKCSSWAAI